MKKEKTRKHTLTEKHSIVSAVLFSIAGFVAIQLLMLLINFIISLIFKGYPYDRGPVGVIISSVLVLWLYKRWFKPDFKGALKGGEYKSVWIVVGIYIIFLVVTSISDMIFSEERLVMPGISELFLALLAGVTEETAFRGLMIPVLVRKNSKKSVIIAILTSSIVFGIAHGSNILAGADPMHSLLQVINSVFVGAALSALYLISGNILIPMLVHFLHDVLAFSHESVSSSSGVLSGGVEISSVIDMGIALVMFVVVLFYVTRSQNTEKIQKLWEKKWQRNIDSNSVPAEKNDFGEEEA